MSETRQPVLIFPTS